MVCVHSQKRRSAHPRLHLKEGGCSVLMALRRAPDGAGWSMCMCMRGGAVAKPPIPHALGGSRGRVLFIIKPKKQRATLCAQFTFLTLTREPRCHTTRHHSRHNHHIILTHFRRTQEARLG